MLTVQTKVSASWYTLESQRDEEQPTKFKINPLNGEQYMEVFAESEQTKGGDLKLTGLGLKMAIRYGVVAWENVIDEKGKALKFNALNVKKLPMEVLSELATEVINVSTPDEDEIKN